MTNIMKIYGQLSSFQQSVGTIKKDSKGYGYTYASLDHIVETITPELKKNNLGFTHTFDGDQIICTLFNTEGETITSRLTLPLETGKGLSPSQLQGVAITYARRYTLSAILGLITDEDTDGAVKTPSQNKNPSEVANNDNKEWLNLADKKGIPTEKYHSLEALMYKKGMTPNELLTLARSKYKVSKDTAKMILEMGGEEPSVQLDN
jgi:hypothetical protein